MIKISFLKNLLRWISTKYVFKHKIADFEVNNKRMLLDLETNGISRALAIYKTREKDKVYLINKLDLRGKKVLDLGSNIGYYSLIMSDLVGEDGVVYCIEPDPRNIKLLKANCTLFGKNNIKQISQIALSETNGFMDLYLSEKSNLSTLINKTTLKSNDKIFNKKVKVKCQRYEEFLKNSELDSFDFVRMDIEGYEQYLIPQIISNNPKCKILFEVHSINYRDEFTKFLNQINNEYKLEYAISTQGGRNVIKKEFNLNPIDSIRSDKRIRYIYKDIDSEIMTSLIIHNPRVLRYALISKK